ncbi:MAG: extracellular solute-binding protein [Patescibacteria group bacterium]
MDDTNLPPVPQTVQPTAFDQPSITTEAPLPPTPVVAPVTPPSASGEVDVVKKSGRKFNLLPILLILILLTALGVGGYFLLGTLQKSQITKLTYWGLWEPAVVMQPLIEEYQAANPNVQITYQMESVREYRERLQSALSQNRGPDIFRIHNSWIPMFKSDLAPVPSTVFSTSQYSSTFYPVASESLTLNSQHLALPLQYEGLIMYVNDQLLSENGLQVPSNWDELRSAAITISRCATETGACKPGARVEVAGAGLGLTDNVDHWQDIVASLLLQNNVNLNSPSGRAAQDVFDFYSSFSRSLGVWESTLSPSTALFQSGKLAIYFAPSWRYHEIRQANPELSFSVHPIPQAPLDPERGERPVTWATFWAEGVNAKSKNAQAAWDFLAFLSTKESLEKMYTAEVALGREFGEIYPRVDMQDTAQINPVVSTVLSGAANSRSWYLASYTFDGPTGINSRLSIAFANVLSGKLQLDKLPAEINAILGQYGLGSAPQIAQ